MKGENAPEWIDKIADSIIKLAAALLVVGINFSPYFEAKRDISIENARAESRVKILRMELALEKAKRPDNSVIIAIKKDLEEMKDTLNKVVELSHAPGG